MPAGHNNFIDATLHSVWQLLKIAIPGTLLFAYASGQELTTVAVLDFEAYGISQVESAVLTNRMRSEMFKTGKVTMVERGMMEQILEEQDFQLAGCSSDECAVEVGRLLGVTHMVAGAIGRIGTTYTVDIRIIDVESGAIIKLVTQDFQGTVDGLLREIEEVALALIGVKETLPVSVVDAVDKTGGLATGTDTGPVELDVIPTDTSPELLVKNIPFGESLESPAGFIPHDEPPEPVGGYSAILQNIEYPESARAEGIEGTVLIQVFVDQTGKVTETRITRGFPEGGLNEAAVAAILRTRFTPAKNRGKPVGVWTAVPVRFALSSTELSEQPKLDDEQLELPIKYILPDVFPAPLGGYAAIMQNIEYPAFAKLQGVEGEAYVQAYVEESGAVTKTKIRKGISEGGFYEAAVAAVLKTKFKPAIFRGEPLGVWVGIAVKFEISSNQTVGQPERRDKPPEPSVDDISHVESYDPPAGFIPHDEAPEPVGGYSAILQNIEYPESARAEGIEGVVMIQAFVDQTGKVTETRIIRGFPKGGLNEAAVAAVLRTRFTPAKFQGKPVGVWAGVPVRFSLSSPQVTEQTRLNDERPESLIEYLPPEVLPVPVGGYGAFQQNIDIEYPEFARAEGIEGEVFVQVFVDQTGAVTGAKVKEGTAQGGFHEAAVAVVHKTRFKPARFHEDPLGVWVSISCCF